MSSPAYLPKRREDGSIGLHMSPATMPDAVRAYCELGWKCFLLAPGSKVPRAGSRGVHDATSDAGALLAELEAAPRSNLAIHLGASGLLGLDVDVGEQASPLPRKQGDAHLAALVREHGSIGWTLRVATWSGGTHFYFSAPAARILSKQNNPREHLDTKSHGGYFVAPPSTIEGERYAWIDPDATLAPPAPWLVEMMREKSPEARPRPIRYLGRFGASSDLSHRVTRARAYVATMDPAVAGQRGHAACFNVAVALVRGFELPEPVALELLAEYSGRCRPPWSAKELSHKIASAQSQSTRAPGFLLGGAR